MALLDNISLIWKVPFALCYFIILLSIRIVVPSKRLHLLHWRQKLPQTLLYTITKVLGRRQIDRLVGLRPLSGQQIQEYCEARGVRHERVTVALPTADFPSAHLHLVTLPDASPSGPTVFYAHGGGYQYPMRARGCMPLVFHLARSCKAARIAFLEYSLTPATQYPGQLIQAVEGLRYLIDQGTSPSDLVLGGDSAGGHLIAGLLLHIKKPAPGLRPLYLHEKIRGAVLLSPWLTMKETSESAIVNEGFDFLHRNQIEQFAKLFKPDMAHIWANPSETPSAKLVWAKVLGRAQPPQSVVHKLLVTAGDAEVLFDSCKRFMQDCAGATPVLMGSRDEFIVEMHKDEPAIFAVGLGEVHVQPALDASQGYYGGGTMIALTAFLNNLQ